MASVRVNGKMSLPKVSGPSIIIVVDGDVGITSGKNDKCQTLKKGSVMFLPADGEANLDGQSCHIFQAYCSL